MSISNKLDENNIQIDNKIYCVKSLSNIHPGGELFVKIFSGRDATKAFLSYHRRIFPHEKMSNYLLRDTTPITTENTLTIQDNSDYLELCEIINKILHKRKSFAPYSYYVKITVLISMTIGLEFYIHMYNCYCWYLSSIMGLFMAWIGLNIQHDANHGAISINPRINRILGMTQNWIGGSAIDWIHQHVVQHHLETNDVLDDPDIQGNILLRFNPIKPLIKFHMFQQIYFFLLISVMGIDVIFESLYNNIRGVHHISMSKMLQYNRLFEIFTTFLFGVRWVIIPLVQQKTWKMMVYVMFQTLPMYVVAGYYLAFFFILSHNFSGTCFYDKTKSNSFLYKQVTSSSNVGGRLLCFFNGGLNYQIEHHLFPRIHHSHYPNIAPFVREFCVVKNIPYTHFPTIYDNLCSFIQHLSDMGSNKHID